MTVRSDRHYVRVYHDDLLRDYPEIYADDGALSTWLRLLVIADKMWPTPPELPRSVKPRPLRVLAECRLVELVPPHGFRIRGHDAERSRRADAARNAAALRWQDRGNAEGHADVMPSTRPRRDETEITPPPAKLGQRKNGTNPRALGTNPRASGTSPRQQKAAEKRGGLDSLATILEKSNRAAEREREALRQEALALHERFQRGEILFPEYERLVADLGKQPDDLTRAGA